MKKLLIEASVFVVALLLFQFIKNQIWKEKEVRFESYVFFDELSVLHTDSKCEGLKNATRYSNARWESVWGLSSTEIEKMCSRCVTAEQSEKLRDMYAK